ncbi:YceI family protein [Paraflavitalea pollutisoli]|uniref:YceI family protein n=1 Tax=Paraflavitalea pollutisoli TaxID=3034143 RepID=UPI0023EB27D3|nr:YceI family protein [Paraflavitalea sp. H1-2-19X]
MRINSLLASTTFCLVGLVACQDHPDPTVAVSPVTAAVAAPPVPANAVAYELTLPTSFVYWEGKSVGGGGHKGFLKPAKGTLALETDGRIVGGYFELEMKTITHIDPKDPVDKESGLEEHLKDPDFFDVKKFPTSTFQLVKAQPGANDSSFTVTGQLTVRGIAREISFPATIARSGDEIHATGTLLIDRTKWGITYQSNSVVGFVKDNLLEDLVPISIDLFFRKQ